MRQITFDEIRSMKGLGSSMRMILKLLIDEGAKIQLVHEQTDPSERYFIAEINGLKIPLRSAKLRLYTSCNSLLAQTIADDKYKTADILAAYQLPTPDTILYTTNEEAKTFLQKHQTIVVKPVDGAHGDGISTNVKTEGQLQKAIERAQVVNKVVLLQQQINGTDHRLLFVDYKFVAAVKRVPASITGDGQHTVKELVEASNEKKAKLWADIRDGVIKDEEIKGSVSKIPLEEIVMARGEDFLGSILSKDEEVQLVDKANVSLGGQTHDITDEVNTELTDKITELLKAIDLPLCGVDVMSNDISSAVHNNTSFIIELNVAPGLRLHEHPMYGQSREVCKLLIEFLVSKYNVLQKSSKSGIITEIS